MLDRTDGAEGSRLTIGTILANSSKEKNGKLKLQLMNGEEFVLEEVKAMTMSAGTNYGMYWLPEIGDQVVVSFLDGCNDRPIVLGCLYSASDPMLKDCNSEKNFIKRLKTKNGLLVDFYDEADKTRITVSTPNGPSVTLQEDPQTITIITGKTQITLDGKKGSLTAEAEKEMVFKVGNATITMKSDGTIQVKGGSVQINSNNSTEIKSSGTLVLKGQKDELSGSIIEVKSSGILTLKGSLTKIN